MSRVLVVGSDAQVDRLSGHAPKSGAFLNPMPLYPRRATRSTALASAWLGLWTFRGM
jgi:hypothetical protein